MSALPSTIHDNRHSHIQSGRVYSSPCARIVNHPDYGITVTVHITVIAIHRDREWRPAGTTGLRDRRHLALMAYSELRVTADEDGHYCFAVAL